MALQLDKLNSPQREAVRHGDGPLLVLAGAGSGKTSTMAYRIAHLIAERGMSAKNILGLSFTRKAANELKERVKKLVSQSSGRSAHGGLTITTFHSLCVRILRNHAETLGYQKNFSILDQNDQKDIVAGILKDIRLDERKFDPDRILFEIGQAKSRFLSGEQAEAFFLEGRLPSDYGIAAASVYARYQPQLKALNAMDFDDLLFNCVTLLEKEESARLACNLLYRHILVDEYQDTNAAQFRLLRLLTERQQNLCVVGDDDQSIYSWRGADPSHILQFSKTFPTAKTITLDRNYRSTTTILDAANGVIANNSSRHPKRLWSDRGAGEPILQIISEEDRSEAEIVAEEILKRARIVAEGQWQQTRPWKDFAVLYRSNSQSRLFEEAFRRLRIPYKIVGGQSFLDRREVKNILCYWRLIVNPKDDTSARRIVNWPARGIGRTSIEAVNTGAVAQGTSFLEALASADLPAKARAGANAFCQLITDLRVELERTAFTPATISLWARRSLDRIGARAALEDDSDDPVQAARRWESVEELANSIGQYDLSEITDSNPLSALREYLALLVLEALDAEEKDEDEQPKEKDEVTLLTLHGAKGLEYPVVFLVGMEEGFLPHKRTIEEATDFGEERRLAYVGITRAKDQLILTRARNRIRFGKTVPRTPSRFLGEISPDLIITRDESHSPDLSTEAAKDAHETKVKDFLASIRAKLEQT